MAMLKVDHLTKSFGGVTAISKLHFEAPEQQVYSIIGPNGAGKTTLFNMLSGIYVPDTGSIQLNGEEIIGKRPHAVAEMGVSRTFQNLQLFFNMTVLDNVAVGCHLRTDSGLFSSALRLPKVQHEERRARDWAVEALAFCGLDQYKDHDAGSLPYGVLKRIEIARALAVQPKLLLMDEPAAGLNDTETLEMRSLIRRISEAGITVMLVEHNMGLVMEVSDRILVIDYGSRLAEGTPEEIQNDPKVIAAYLGGELQHAM
ncbi:MAG: ABC transporter ATP-binding protein [Chromatiales bacterium]|nr:ABC transporter ATP-binding protein [Chromatiales bacterium]